MSVGSLQEGQFYSLKNFFADQYYETSAKAHCESIVISVDREEFLSIVRKSTKDYVNIKFK